MQLSKAGKRGIQVIQGERAFGMPGDLNAIPGAQVQKDLALGFFDLLLNDRNFFLQSNAEGMLFGVLSQLLKLALQFCNRLLEVELMFHPLQFSYPPGARQR